MRAAPIARRAAALLVVAGAARSAGAQTVAFTGVSVIPMTAENRIDRERTVVVRGDRIVAVGPDGTVPLPDGAVRIDGRGKYLLPGLADAHVHFRADTAVNAGLLRLYLAWGVTSVLNLNGHSAVLELRDAVAAGRVPGPTIHTSGPILNDSSLTFADGERLALEQAAAGYEFIKVYNRLARPAYWGLLAASRRLGIPVVGHVVRSLDAEGLARCESTIVVCACEHCFETTLTSGQAAIVHMEEVVYGRFRHHAIRNRLPLDGLLREVPAVARRVAESGVWVIPTLEVYRNIPRQLDSLPQVLARPEMRHVPRAMRDGWVAERNPYHRTMSQADAPGFREGYALQAALTAAFQRAGVRLLAGTDVGVPSVIAGLSLHWELQHLVEAGLTPYQALLAATARPGEFLDRGGAGTVAAGQRADLLLLDADPLDDIRHTQRIAGVMARGRWYSAGALRELLGPGDPAR